MERKGQRGEKKDKTLKFYLNLSEVLKSTLETTSRGKYSLCVHAF